MAILEVVSGSCPGQIVPLQQERMVLGRHPSCHIVIDNAAVSRNHAQILENHGSFFIEDLRSRNGTQVNGSKIQGRRELKDNDEIQVCEMAFRFRVGSTPDLSASTVLSRREDEGPEHRAQTVAGEDFEQLQNRLYPQQKPVLADDLSDSSSIISVLDVANARHPRLTIRPEAKLRAILEISKNLARTLDLSGILPKLLEGLFFIYPQADRGFVVLKDPETDDLEVQAARFRKEEPPETAARLSSTIIQEAMKTARAILSADARSQFDKSESLHGLKICSLMCAPLVSHQGETLGVIQLDTRDTRHQFSQDDLDVLAAVGAQAVLAIENARLYEGMLKQRDLERELEFANQVQLGFLPTERPTLEGYEFADFYEAAYRVSGDFFDYVPLPDGRLALGVGDVAGKGVAAALLMARLYAAARYELLSSPSPAIALQRLNDGLVAGGMGHRFVTSAFCFLDPRQHRLTIVNAGHPPPLIRTVNGTVERIGEKDSGLPLGVTPDVEYNELTIPIDQGDTILMFTDGITEAMDPENSMYGNRRLADFLSQPFSDLGEMLEGLVKHVEDFCRDRPQRDDVCLIAFRRK